MKKRNILIAVVCLCAFAMEAQQQSPIYLDDNQPIEKRVEDALQRMTLEEKVALCHAQSKFSSAGVPRLGIPENWATDGPNGIRPEVKWDEWDQAGWTNDSCIAFPALTCLAATWNPEIAYLFGKSIGEEARYRDKNILLGPGINILRTPLNGRNFEYMGEDPYLVSKLVVPYIQGVQSNGVAACVKHFALNNQEIARHWVDVNVSDRALYEIYLPAFKAAVQEGGVWSIMGAYNRYKQQYLCHNQYLLNDILRKEWKFDGVVVSDWGGTHNTMEAIYNGLDLEFATGTDGLAKGGNPYDYYHLALPFQTLLQEGKVSEEILNAKARNILRLIFRTNMNKKRPYGSFASPEHAQAARTIAQEGIVLLKNSNSVLPIDPAKTKKIAVIGENAIRMMTVGGGSSSLKALYEVSPLEGLKKAVGNKAEIVYAKGYKSGDTKIEYNSVVVQDLTEERTEAELMDEALKAAKDADMVVYFGGLNKNPHFDSEEFDRKDLNIPYGQDRLISELAKVNKKLVVVLISGGAVSMPWLKEVPAILQAWYLGNETGNALASVLLGEVNPSGKLPMTFSNSLSDYGAHVMGDYPGGKEETYKEGIFVGYRWTDKQKVKPNFPFGHGLSYTTFEYGKPSSSAKTMTENDELKITLPVTNTGLVAGKETVQLYISDLLCSKERPVKELKAFSKIELQPQETKNVEFTVKADDLKFFDEVQHIWVAEPGKFKAMIGASSGDIKQVIEFELK